MKKFPGAGFPGTRQTAPFFQISHGRQESSRELIFESGVLNLRSRQNMHEKLSSHQKHTFSDDFCMFSKTKKPSGNPFKRGLPSSRPHHSGAFFLENAALPTRTSQVLKKVVSGRCLSSFKNQQCAGKGLLKRVSWALDQAVREHFLVRTLFDKMCFL